MIRYFAKFVHRDNSATGTRTRVARVRADYPNQLDYSGSDGAMLQKRQRAIE